MRTLPARTLALRASGDRALALYGSLMADFVTTVCGRETRWLPDVEPPDLVLTAITAPGRRGLRLDIGESQIELVEPRRPGQCQSLVDDLRSVALGQWSPGTWTDDGHDVATALLLSAVEAATVGDGPLRPLPFFAEPRSRERPAAGRPSTAVADSRRLQADVELIRSALRARRGLFIGCFETALSRRAPTVRRAVLSFTAEPDGRASSTSVRFPTDAPSLQPLGDCLRRVIDVSPFPRARSEAVPVKYPLVFTRSTD